MGGPKRMSRVDMAEAVADARGRGRQAILPVPAASVDRGVASPADISMDSSLLQVWPRGAAPQSAVQLSFSAHDILGSPVLHGSVLCPACCAVPCSWSELLCLGPFKSSSCGKVMEWTCT